MGFAGIVKDLIDDDYSGLTTGWSIPRPEIKWSDKGRKIRESIEKKRRKVTRNVKQSDSIEFWKQPKTETLDVNQGRYLFAWRNENERRINELYHVLNHMNTPEIKEVIKIAINDLHEADDAIADILNKQVDMFYDIEGMVDSSGGYIQEFCDELLTQVLQKINGSIFGEDIVSWVHDLKYLAAVAKNVQVDNEYKCSGRAYINYIKKKGLKSVMDETECEYCHEQEHFENVHYCLMCGKRRSN